MTDANSSLLTLEPFVSHRCYTLWRLEAHREPGGKPRKVPVHYDGRTHHDLGSDVPGKERPANPAPPLSASECAAWIAHHRATGTGHATPGQVGYIGAGFRPAGTGLVCIDLDDCIVEGKWSHGAAAVLAQLPGALVEQSVSGTGAHVWVTTSESPGRCPQRSTPHGALEIYGEGQFIALGTVLGGDASVDHTAAVMAMVRNYWPERAPGAAPVVRDLPGDVTPAVLADLQSALDVLDPDCSNDEWVSVGQALSGLGEVGYAMWAAWSARSTRFPGGDGLDRWDSFTGERTDYRAIFAKAQRGGWVNPSQRPALPADAGAVFAAAVGVPGMGGGAVPAGMVTEPPASRQVAAAGDLSFMAAAQGLIASTVASVETALMSAECGIAIAYDTFLEQTSIAIGGESPRAFEDEDYGDLRARLERRGFKPVPAEIMRTVVGMVAKRNKFDSALMWIESLAWDGVPRIDTAMQTYYGCEATPYASAVGAYLFTGLAGRCTTPGIKADMAVILVGLQGARKTTAVEALCPTPEAFGEIDLSKSDDALARSMRGKLVLELAELKGLSGRDSDSIKAWMSRRVEEWRPVYREAHIRYGRRGMVIGTDNVGEFLDDPTGARRFLPIQVGEHVGTDALMRDRDQLWAEGLVRFRASGIAWQDAERLAKAEHSKFETVEENLALVSAWLAQPPAVQIGAPIVTTPRSHHPVRGVDVLIGALNYQPSQIKKADQMMLSKIMRRLNYVRTTQRQDGAPVKLWVTTVKPPFEGR